MDDVAARGALDGVNVEESHIQRDEKTMIKD